MYVFQHTQLCHVLPGISLLGIANMWYGLIGGKKYCNYHTIIEK